MLELIIWLSALFCTNPTHTLENHGNCNLIHIGSGTVTTNGDTGNENGGTPRPPVPPPPPPPGGGN